MRNGFRYLIALIALVGSVPIIAQPPPDINYQGRLLDAGGVPLEGPVKLTLKIYDAMAGGGLLYKETHQAVQLSDGVFDIALGTGTVDNGTFDAQLFSDPNRYLEVVVGEETLEPRQPFHSVAYALIAERIGSLEESDVVTDVVAAGSALQTVRTMGAIELTIRSQGVTRNMLQDGAVGPAQIEAGAVTRSKLDANLQAALDASSGWSLTGNAGTSPTTNFLGTTDDSPLELRVAGLRALRLEYDEEPTRRGVNVIGGYPLNALNAACNAQGASSVTGATVFGGGVRTDLGEGRNCVGGDFGVVSGGLDNQAGGLYSTIGGGFRNQAAALGATVPGGGLNQASGSYSLAAGRQAHALHEGSFVWADSSAASFESQSENQFRVRAAGGARFDVGNGGWVEIRDVDQPDERLITTSTGAYLSSTGLWVDSSDRAKKENFEPVDPRAVLEQVERLPLATWNFKSDEDSMRHIGPVAQDFDAAFQLGGDGQHIASLDANGVALAAIQGLVEELRDRDARIDALAAELRELKGRIAH